MEAVLYCIHEYEMSNTDSITDRHDITVGKVKAEEAYLAGRKLVHDKVRKLMREYEELMTDFCDYGNSALLDTIQRGIPEFLKRYDIKYEPQNTILTLDYPVLPDLCEYCGIDRVYPYVKAVSVEQTFLRHYEREYVKEVLRAYSRGYQDMLENIAGIVLMNTIGHLLSDKPLEEMIEPRDLKKIQSGFENGLFSREKVRLLTEDFLENCFAKEDKVAEYLGMELDNILVRIEQAVMHGYLGKVFVR